VAAVGLADLVHRADVRVVQRRGRPGLSRQASLREAIGFGLGRKELQRDTTAELRVISEIDFGHPASADLGANQVPAELHTRGNRNTGTSQGRAMPLATRG